MAGLFDPPKLNLPPVPNPEQTQNQLNQALADRLQGGGTNADILPGGPSALSAPMGMGSGGGAPAAKLTGLN